jgi:formylglycine-generating enzyme required for sulfatase activity
MTAIASGVSAAHRHGIVHRDLKPLNIMLQYDKPLAEAIKILDFGLAKIKSGELLGSFVLAQTIGMMGSPHYMAPEQWSDEELDQRSDIYSLGIILFQMLAGDVPFKGVSVPTIMKKHLMDPPPHFAELNMNVPPAIEQVVQHALEKNPDKRPATTEEFIRELQQAVITSAAMDRALGVERNAQFERTAPLLRAERRTAEQAEIPDIEETRSSEVEVARYRLEEEALRQAEAEKTAEEQRRREEEQRLAEEEARRQAEEDAARLHAEEERRRQAELEQQRLEAEAEAQRKAEEEAARLRAEEERRRVEEEKRLAAEAQARRQAEEEARVRAEEEERQRAEEARLAAEAEAQRKAEEEARKRAEEEAKRRAAEEERKRAEEEARQRAEAEAARLRAEEEARLKAEEEARQLAALEEERRQAEEAARLKALEEERLRVEAEAKRKAVEEAERIRAAEAARKREEEEARRKVEEEERLRAEAFQRQAEEERRRQEEKSRQRAKEDARRATEEAARQHAAEEERRRADEERFAVTIASDVTIEPVPAHQPIEETQRYEGIKQKTTLSESDATGAPDDIQKTRLDGVINPLPPSMHPMEVTQQSLSNTINQKTANTNPEAQKRWQQFAPPAQTSTSSSDLPAQKKSFPRIYIGAALLVLLLGSVGLYFLTRQATDSKPQQQIPQTTATEEQAKPGGGTTGTSTVPAREMVFIAGGSFQLGRNDGTAEETPAHTVTLKPFYIDKTEVTNAQYAECVQATGCSAPSGEKETWWQPWDGDKPPAGQEQWPVRNVSVADAETYARWLSKRDGVTYRLPREDEWENAARDGASAKLYPWGNQWINGYANIDSSLPKPVGSYKQGATGSGVLDLIGNVWEWTLSKASYYPGNGKKVPLDEQGFTVVRGGSYQSKAGDNITATFRAWPKLQKHPTIGFRLVRESP